VFGDDAIYESFKKRSKKAKFSADEYDTQLSKIGEHGDEINTMQYLQQHQPDDERIEAMAKELEEQANRRAQFSRRRTFNEDADVTFINERNRNFNKKIARAFDKYTVEIKENLERGTAL
jgi:CRISPR/Cas system CSM-associated protein Csm4 (group 5 of RAMP superfamily)